MQRKEINIFGTSFLDLLSGAFAAVIILFIIVPKMSSEQQDALEEMERLHLQVQDLGQMMEQLQNSVPQELFEQVQRQIEDLQNSLSELSEQIRQLQNELAATREENERMRNELAELDEVRQQCQELQQENERLRQQIAELLETTNKYARRKVLRISHLIEISTLLRNAKVNEDKLAKMLQERRLMKHTSRLMQILADTTGLEEGFMIATAINDRVARNTETEITKRIRI